MESFDLPALINLDPWLQPASGSVRERTRRFHKRIQEIENQSGSLDAFASAYHYLGIHKNEELQCFIYREFAPNARQLYLTGDFNGWDRHAHPLKKIDSGVWEIRLDFPEYKDRFLHGSRVKVLVDSCLGEQLRIPAYATRVIQDEESKDFSCQLWFPDAFDWQNEDFVPKQKDDLLIYEAHVGMAQEKEGIGTYREFTERILPKIKKQGYNTIQLMAIQEHPYYGSFGYHVSNFFAPSSRFGTPEELKELIRTAHQMGLAVVMDLVHSHFVRNTSEGLNLFDGTELYSFGGERGEHPQWDSKLFNYGRPEVLQFLLSNVKYWLQEFHFDGFRFDGVGSMMYFHHGNQQPETPFDFFENGVEKDAVTYLQLANRLIHKLNPHAVSIAEDVTGMPGLTVDPEAGGIGFDYRLGMGIPDFWIKYLKDYKDEDWDIYEMWRVLNDRLPYVKTVAYAESHDQALVGDKTIAFRLMDQEMYYHMRVSDSNPVIDRGIALHKMIRLFTLSLGGQAYLNFMGNEFGHPEWIDFPRQGNNWSYKYASRQWSLVTNKLLKYQFLNNFDKALLKLAGKYGILSSDYAQQLNMDAENKCIIFERNQLIFLFNFHVSCSIPDYEFTVPHPGDYEIILCTDHAGFGGLARVNETITYPAFYHQGLQCNRLRIYFPNRTAIVLKQVKKPRKKSNIDFAVGE